MKIYMVSLLHRATIKEEPVLCRLLTHSTCNSQ